MLLLCSQDLQLRAWAVPPLCLLESGRNSELSSIQILRLRPACSAGVYLASVSVNGLCLCPDNILALLWIVVSLAFTVFILPTSWFSSHSHSGSEHNQIQTGARRGGHIESLCWVGAGLYHLLFYFRIVSCFMSTSVS